MTNTIDIKANARFPGGALSNFAAHRFVLDGVKCGSMEGFLQGLKVKDPADQLMICALSGGEARGRGQRHVWNVEGLLYWRGQAIDRLSDDYQMLLDRAFDAMFEQCKKFRDALEVSGNCELQHSIGKDDPTETILTRSEFLERLLRLRAALMPQQ